jgi:hypothetical protein
VLKTIDQKIHFSFHRKSKNLTTTTAEKRRKKLCDTPTKIVHDTIPNRI